jgi:hypothetical protein
VTEKKPVVKKPVVLDLPLYIIERINELQKKDKEQRLYRIPKGALVTQWLEASPPFIDGNWKPPADGNGHGKPTRKTSKK